MSKFQLTNTRKMGLVFILGLFLVSLVMLIAAHLRADHPSEQDLQAGDIIFQSLDTPGGEAIRLATESSFSHCGVLYKQDGQWFVYEAIGPVKLTPLFEWIDRGRHAEYEIKRLRNAAEILDAQTLAKMFEIGRQFVGKAYDPQFKWSDARMYCSELVWKIYRRGAGISLGNLRTLEDYKLDHPSVQEVLRQRYGDAPPYQELMIAPATIYRSDKLETVVKS